MHRPGTTPASRRRSISAPQSSTTRFRTLSSRSWCPASFLLNLQKVGSLGALSNPHIVRRRGVVAHVNQQVTVVALVEEELQGVDAEHRLRGVPLTSAFQVTFLQLLDQFGRMPLERIEQGFQETETALGDCRVGL